MTMTSATLIHEAASKGFHNATAYDTHRPSYPPAAVDALLKHIGLEGKGGARIVDLAAGTGKFTELLAGRGEGFDITAVEPLGSMRGTLARKDLRGVRVQEGKADGMEVETGWLTEWLLLRFANEKALGEISRVLKPGGRLAMIWNIENYNDNIAAPAATAWEQSLKEASLSITSDDQPRYRDNKWQEVFERQAQADEPLFSTPIAVEKIPFKVRLTPDALWDRLRTLSHVAILEGETKNIFRERFDEILRGAERVGEKREEVDITGYTCIAWTRKI